MKTPFPTDSELAELVTAALASKDRGESIDLEALCGQRPDVIEAVASSLALAERIPSLRASAASRSRYTGCVLAGRYLLKERIGAGGMGVVYSALDRELRRPVAVKLLRSMLMEGHESEERFRREAETLASLQHTAIVKVFDRGHSPDGDPFLVMELLEGVSLSELMDCFSESTEGPGRVELATIAMRLGSDAIDEKNYLRQVVRWVAQIASGLESAHSAGIYHRDVKPSNVFVRKDGCPVLLDFGIASDAARGTLTREGAYIGTPAYMAPEVLAEELTPGPALDIYGLTATLYHLLTLRPPYTGSPSQILTALAARDPVRAGKLMPSLPRDLQAILDRGMARHAPDRYPTAGALMRDLQAFLDHRLVEARPLSFTTRLLRRLRASKSFRGGLAVFAAMLLVLTTVGWKSHLRESRLRSFRSAWSHVAGNFTLGNPAYRHFGPLLANKFREVLDEAVSYADEPIPANLVRAAFRLDMGDPVGASEDMQCVARAVDSTYANALADAYDRMDPAAASAQDLDLSGLPPPESALDHYLAAYHARRADPRADVRSLLDLPGLEEHAPSLELGLAYVVGKQSSPALEIISRLEQLTGGRTASSAHWLGTHLFYLGEYERALKVLQEGIALNDSAHALHVYAGWSCLRLGRPEEAISYFEDAKFIRPESSGAFELQARALIDCGRFNEARDVAESAPFGANARSQGRRALLLAELESERSLDHYRHGDEDAAQSAAMESVALFQEAATLGVDIDLPRAVIANAISTGEHSLIFQSILGVMEEQEALDGRWLDVLLDWMPDKLDSSEVDALRSMLESLR